MFQRNFYEIKRILDCFPPKIPTCEKIRCRLKTVGLTSAHLFLKKNAHLAYLNCEIHPSKNQ